MRYVDRWGQSKITTGPAVANVIDDFTLTPAFTGFYSDPGIYREPLILRATCPDLPLNKGETF